MKELGDVVKKPAEARCIAAVPLVQAGAAAVEEKDGESRPGEVLTGMLVPAAVTLDAVHADNAAERSVRWRLVATIVPAVAGGGGERLHGSGRLGHTVQSFFREECEAPQGLGHGLLTCQGWGMVS